MRVVAPSRVGIRFSLVFARRQSDALGPVKTAGQDPHATGMPAASIDTASCSEDSTDCREQTVTSRMMNSRSRSLSQIRGR